LRFLPPLSWANLPFTDISHILLLAIINACCGSYIYVWYTMLSYV
jgi:hypothetical protein